MDVTPDEVARVRPQLMEFASWMLAGVFRRKDQRAKGELYLQGLLLDGQRKSMQPMAERLGVDHQSLQQFITSSTWDHEAVLANLARWGASALGPDAYVIEDTAFLKAGHASPLVAPMYSAALRRTVNCQLGVSVQMAASAVSLATNWRLFCPASWDDTMVEGPDRAAEVRRRRGRAGVPGQVRHQATWRLALRMLDQLTNDWELPKLPVNAGVEYGDVPEFRLGLAERGYRYVVAVGPTGSAQLATLRPATAGSSTAASGPPQSLRDLALAVGREAFVRVPGSRGSRGSRGTSPAVTATSAFHAVKIHSVDRDSTGVDDDPMCARLLLAEWPDSAAEPSRYWLSNLADDTPLPELVGLAKIGWCVQYDRELRASLGLDHFEGRSFTGWHRHVTLVCLAQAFCALLRLDLPHPRQAGRT